MHPPKCQRLQEPNPDGTSEQYGLKQRAYSAEVRLTSPDPDASLGWIGGVFYSQEHARSPHDGNDGVPSVATVISKNEFGIFGQIALKITNRLTASAGLRIGHSHYDSSTELQPIFRAQASDTWAAARYGLSYQADEDNLIFLTVAKGYGSAGVYPGLNYDPHPYPADALWSYEIGSKHELLSGRLRLETSIFRIQWNNGPPDLGIGNVSEQDAVPGTAVSVGFGFTAQALLTEHLKATLGISYSDAHSTETVTLDGQLFVLKGESLTGSPWHVVGSMERDFSLQGDVTARVRMQDVFRSSPGRIYSNNPASAFYNPRTDPSTNALNIQCSMNWTRLTVAASLSNVLGSQPSLSGIGTGATFIPTGSEAVTLVPRMLSISGTWRF